MSTRELFPPYTLSQTCAFEYEKMLVIHLDFSNNGNIFAPLSIQGVRTSVLQLDHLEVGDYTFTLKVTDTAGQSSTADVHVFVKPGTVYVYLVVIIFSVSILTQNSNQI